MAPSSATPNPSSLWKRVAGAVTVFLLFYLAVAYLIVPQVWKMYARHRPSFDDNPRLTTTHDGHPGDALNVALVGTESELKAIMLAASWYRSDSRTLRSDVRITAETMLKQPYDEAFVTELYLYGRREDFAFEQPVDDPYHRHHIRFWRSKTTDQDRPIWVGAATYDQRVKISHTTDQITHHSAADIDTERAHVFDTLEHTTGLAAMYKVPGFHKQLEWKNGDGERCYTDGALWVGEIRERFESGGDLASKLTTTSAKSGQTMTAIVLQADLRVLRSSSTQMEQVVAEMQSLAKSAPWRESGFFDAGQQDQIERLLFSYLACRHTLWHLANYSKDNDIRYPDAAAKAKSSTIAFHAGFQLILSDASLVNAFRGDTVAIDKLNEAFYRSRIPARTYERLLLAVTNEEHLSALSDSFLLYTQELEDPDSAIARIVKQSSAYSDLVSSTESAAQSVDAMVQKLVKTQSRFLPDLNNRLRHTRVSKWLRTLENKSGVMLFAARAHLFKGMSRIKNPEAHLIKFTLDQKRQVYDALEPGDIILTFTAGYISDIFIPGSFKHAITYVGSPRDRQEAGLSADHLTWLQDAQREVLLESFGVATLPSGQDADVIESVGEGVIFNHLGHIMDTHINRMLVLRPQVTREQRIQALANVFLFLGDEYDFKFDFADASKQVCTEVVYRALDGKSSIVFSLVERAGHETLSADDIANEYLGSPGKAFDFVLFAEESPNSRGHRARILLGEDGMNRLTQLMAKVNE